MLTIFHRRILTNSTDAQLARGTIAAVATRILGAGLGLTLQLILARMYGADVYGEYVYVLSWITVLALFGRIGLDTASLRFLSAYGELSKESLVRGFIKRSTQIVLFASCFVACVSWSTISVMRDRFGSSLVETFFAGLILLPIISVMQLHASHVQALKHVGQAQLPQGVLRPLVFAAAAYYFLQFGFEPRAVQIMRLDLLATILAAAISWFLVRRIALRPLVSKNQSYETGLWLRTSIPLVAISGAQIALAKADIIVVGVVMGSREAGKYAVATVVAGLVTFFIHAANQIIAPLISELYVRQRFSELQRMVSNTVTGLFLLMVPFLIIVVRYGDHLLAAFGDGFSEAYQVLVVLLVGQAVIVSWGSVGFLLTMTGHEREASWVIGSTAAANVILNVLLVPLFGAIGAAVATTIAVSVRSSILGLIVWKRLGIFPTPIGLLARRIQESG